jgi:hypothetical protein
MNGEFNWWLLVVGLVVGAGLVWLVLADIGRESDERQAADRSAEARWIAARMTSWSSRPDPTVIQAILDLHRAYLDEEGEPPPSNDPPAE